MGRKIKRFLGIIIAIALIVGVIALVGSIFNPTKTKTVFSSTFKVGGLNEKTGEYVQTDDSLYSDWIQCKGLVVQPDFETQVEYQVFYYNYDKKFIDATEKFKLETYEKGIDYEYAKYCRIVIYPNRGGESLDDFKIYFWQVLGYADDITITVSNKQGFNVDNLYETATLYDDSMGDQNTILFDTNVNAIVFTNKSCMVSSTETGPSLQLSVNETSCVLRINVKDIKSLSVDASEELNYYSFVSKDLNPIIQPGNIIANKTTIINIDDDIQFIAFNIPANIENIKINVYLPR